MTTTVKYVKITVKLEFEEEQIKDLFESYDIKFTQAKLKELKQSIKDGEVEFHYELEDSVLGILGDYIQSEFGE